jgi:hypothetical protein
MSVARTLSYVASRGITSAVPPGLPIKPAVASANTAIPSIQGAHELPKTPVLERMKLRKVRHPNHDADAHLFASASSGRLNNPRNAA